MEISINNLQPDNGEYFNSEDNYFTYILRNERGTLALILDYPEDDNEEEEYNEDLIKGPRICLYINNGELNKEFHIESDDYRRYDYRREGIKSLVLWKAASILKISNVTSNELKVMNNILFSSELIGLQVSTY